MNGLYVRLERGRQGGMVNTVRGMIDTDRVNVWIPYCICIYQIPVKLNKPYISPNSIKIYMHKSDMGSSWKLCLWMLAMFNSPHSENNAIRRQTLKYKIHMLNVIFINSAQRFRVHLNKTDYSWLSWRLGNAQKDRHGEERGQGRKVRKKKRNAFSFYEF